MSQYIHTLLHVLGEQEIFNQETGCPRMMKDYPVMQKMLEAPHFVIQKGAIELLERADIAATIAALYEARLTRLPYPTILIEFNDLGGIFRHFVLLEEVDSHKAFRPTWAFYDMQQKFGGMQKIGATLSIVEDGKMLFEFDDSIIGTRNIQVMEHGARMVRIAADICFMLLNTKGIEKEVIECKPSLNKRRVAKGLCRIPKHHYVHLAKVYKKDGTYEPYSAVKHRRMHLRKGHVRRQRFGKGLEESRIIYIEPILVNYDPEQKLEHRTVSVTK